MASRDGVPSIVSVPAPPLIEKPKPLPPSVAEAPPVTASFPAPRQIFRLSSPLTSTVSFPPPVTMMSFDLIVYGAGSLGPKWRRSAQTSTTTGSTMGRRRRRS
jgi:hypothetical protein